MAQPSNITRSGNVEGTDARSNRWRGAGFAAVLVAAAILFGASPAAAQCGNDPGNDYLAAATPVPGCTNVPADIDCAGDVDYYSFVAPNSGLFTFLTSGSMDTVMKLYDPNGVVIEENDDGGQNHNARIDETLTVGVTYKVAVNDWGNDDIGAYQLEITGCAQSPSYIKVSGSMNFYDLCIQRVPLQATCPGYQELVWFTVPGSFEYKFG